MLTYLPTREVNHIINPTSLLNTSSKVSQAAREAFESAYLNCVNNQINSPVMEAFLQAEKDFTSGLTSRNQFEAHITTIMRYADAVQDNRIANGGAIQSWQPKLHGWHPWLTPLATLGLKRPQPATPMRLPILFLGSDTPNNMFLDLVRWILSHRSFELIEAYSEFIIGEPLNLGQNRGYTYLLARRASGEFVATYESKKPAQQVAVTLHPQMDNSYTITLKWSNLPEALTLLHQAEQLTRETGDRYTCTTTFYERKAA